MLYYNETFDELWIDIAVGSGVCWKLVSSHDVRLIDLKWWDRETIACPLSASINQFIYTTRKESLFNIETQLDIFSLMLT